MFHVVRLLSGPCYVFHAYCATLELVCSVKYEVVSKLFEIGSCLFPQAHCSSLLYVGPGVSRKCSVFLKFGVQQLESRGGQIHACASGEKYKIVLGYVTRRELFRTCMNATLGCEHKEITSANCNIWLI